MKTAAKKVSPKISPLAKLGAKLMRADLARVKVSRVPDGTVTRKPAGATGGRSLAATPEPRRGFSKGPTVEQFTAMAGSMYNALEKLRQCSADWKRRADANEGWLQPGHVVLVLSELDAAANILRVGLKARFRK